MDNAKHIGIRERILRILARTAIGILIAIPAIPILFSIANIASGHKLSAKLVGCLNPGFGPELVMEFQSPNGDLDCLVLVDGFQGVDYSLLAARWYNPGMPEVLRCGRKDYVGPRGPRELSVGLAWSAGGDRVAMILSGWYVDYYDFDKESRDSFGDGLFMHTKVAKLRTYHKRIAGLIGQNPTIIDCEKSAGG